MASTGSEVASTLRFHCLGAPIVQVQRHDCRPRKCYSKCADGEPQVCKFDYPREWCKETVAVSERTGKNIYRCECEEDRRLSPYVPLWLLATGDNIYIRWAQ